MILDTAGSFSRRATARDQAGGVAFAERDGHLLRRDG